MLLAIFEDNLTDARHKAKVIIKSKSASAPNALNLSFDVKEFLNTSTEELHSSRALFKQEYMVLLDAVLSEDSSKEKFFASLDALAESEHLFVLAQDCIKLNDNEKKLLKKRSLKLIFNCSKKRDIADKRLFAFVDTLFFGSKKEAWLVFCEVSNSFSPEQIYGTINWAFKNLLAAQKSPRLLKPYLRARYESLLKQSDFEKILWQYENFLQIPKKSRTSGIELKDLLESWILSLNIKND